MPAFSASAPGKAILFGEHAVVYGKPAIAVPVRQVQAKVIIRPNPKAQAGMIHVQAPAIGLDAPLSSLPADHPLQVAIRLVLSHLQLTHAPACTLRITSTIPLAAGLGSGAAVSVALMRSFSGFLGRPLLLEQISSLAFEVEKLYHGTPSGIDNTVVTYARPIYFQRGLPIEIIQIPTPLTLVIGDTGIASPTAQAVGDVRRAWQSDPPKFEKIFAGIGELVREARTAIENGQLARCGALMDANHTLLVEIGVSCPELDKLVETARSAGALGAKLSGGGRGGNMIAMATTDTASEISSKLVEAGARATIITQVEAKV
ncbi:MAG TPA: mevalonate kinase [Anaerolineales bacterium]|nr:mevalonate kinase [Anaerolineales bacterium]